MKRYYTSSHEYVQINTDIATVGITQHAAEQLGDVVYVEHPEVGVVVSVGQPLSVVESTKAASEVYAPLSGVVHEVNSAIVDDPSLVSKDAEGDSWFFKIKISDPAEIDNLLDEKAYKEIVG